MASAFFALFDDIAAIMDDVAAMTKVATKKTAGVVGDDLALNANMLTGLHANRELPVIWAVGKGSLINKAILVPLALLLSAFLPWAVGYVLMIGGAFLCYEGVEKVWHRLFHHAAEVERQHARLEAHLHDQDLVALERDKIRAAVRTDFILSAEIVVIALGVLVERQTSLGVQIVTLSLIALLVTVLVYWQQKYEGVLKACGRVLLWFAPKMLKALSVIGTIAMFVVGGHIWVEHVPFVHDLGQRFFAALQGWQGTLASYALDIVVGVIVGLGVFALITPLQRVLPRKTQ